MDKRKYMKPNCEAVAVNCSDSFLEFTSIVSVGGMAKQDKKGRRGNSPWIAPRTTNQIS